MQRTSLGWGKPSLFRSPRKVEFFRACPLKYDDVPLGDIEIRPAGLADAPAIASCLAAAFECYRNAYSPAAFADTVPDSEQIALRIQKMRVLIAVNSKKVVGTISALINEDHGHLRGMAVLPNFQGSGIASKLLAEIEHWLRSQRCHEVTLDTTEPLTVAMKFYERHGYRRSGKISDFFGMPLIGYVKVF